MAEDRMLSDEILLGLIKANSGGGGGGTSDYSQLSNKPQINGTTLTGNKSASDLGLVAEVDGKGLSTNDYTDADKAIVGGVTAALAGKQDVLTAGKYINIDTNNEISVNPVVPNEAFKYVLQQIENYTIKVTKSVNNVVVSEETYGPPTGWDAPVEATLDEAIHIYIHMTGTMFYDLLIASDTHEAGFKQTMSWFGRDTFTENFSTVDHSGEKLITKSELDTAINAIKDGQSIDSFADVETALANKQDKTDNNLETTSKTLVGAINELKSGLTSKQNSLSLGGYINNLNNVGVGLCLYGASATGSPDNKRDGLALTFSTTFDGSDLKVQIAYSFSNLGNWVIYTRVYWPNEWSIWKQINIS